jgi:multidrug efflux pump subunit AcrA (membrane-fusion protein)
MRTKHWLVTTGTAFACLAAFSSCAEEVPLPPPRPRPISVVMLKEMDPVGPLQLTGSVKAWKEQDVSFEVSGPVAFIVDTTTYVEGRWEEDGTIVTEGDVLARLDPREYRIARDIAQASVVVAEQNVGLGQVELVQVLPANKAAAKANLDRGEAEYLRIERARQKNAVSELDLIRALADRDQARAGFQQSEAAVEAKKAEIISLEASVKQAQEQLAQAQYDLDRCTLRSPAKGEVAEVFVEAGGFAAEGSPVTHLVMMDPMKVDLALSSGAAALIKEGDRVRVYPPGSGESIEGWIYQKGTVADPDTRTFRVSIMCRNEWRYGGFEPGSPLLELPRVDMLSRLVPMRPGDPAGSMGVEATRGLYRDEATGESYVWATDDVPLGQFIDRASPTVRIHRVKVVPGEERRNFQGLLVLQALDDVGSLTGSSLIALDVPEGLEDGAQILVAKKDWLLRAGQIVRVLLAGKEPQDGLYLPLNLIKPIDQGSGYVFVEQDGKAIKVRVNLLEKAGALARVVPADQAQAGILEVGAHVIAEHVHFLQDGELVRVVETLEPSK